MFFSVLIDIQKINTKWKLKNIKLILTYRKITSTKMKHSNLLISVILLSINERYRKKNKGKKEREINEQR